MPTFVSAGIPINYLDQGAGYPVVLVHGFASSANNNWVEPGWIRFLSPRHRVIALDQRGHGSSGKPRDSEAYDPNNLAADIVGLMDHLEIEKTFLMGYSMGATVSLVLAISHPSRFRAAVLGGIGGDTATQNLKSRDAIIQALLTEDPESIGDPVAKTSRAFADSNRNDLKALAACMGRERPRHDAQSLARIAVPMMLVVGTRDALVANADQLAASIPGAELVTLEGRDHLNAVGDKRYKESVARFFAAH
jgi:pimeloyl-ACP methyl ester carboxylesterase